MAAGSSQIFCLKQEGNDKLVGRSMPMTENRGGTTPQSRDSGLFVNRERGVVESLKYVYDLLKCNKPQYLLPLYYVLG